MIDAFIRFFLQRPVAAGVLAAVVAAAGWGAFEQLRIEAFPDPTDTAVQVITRLDGQPAEEVERQVSVPIERALNGTPGLVRLRSVSLFGLSFVTMTFGDGVDAWFARAQTLERLREADLPEGVRPELGPLATPIGEIYRYTLKGRGADPMTLRTLQDWVVRPELLRVQGVADVVSYGGLLREVHVRPDPDRMAALGVTLDEIAAALGRASRNASGGAIERGDERLVIRSLGIFVDADAVERVAVGEHEGIAVLLRDVARVQAGYAPRQGVVTRGADEDVVEGIVLLRRGENPSQVLDALRERVTAINSGVLPDGVHIAAFYDRTELVDTTLRTVFRNLVEGALLVVLILAVFLRSIRAALVVAVLIPLSLAASFIYLQARGMSANLLSMGAVDFGIIVDGAVILVEHLVHRHAHPARGTEALPLRERMALAAQEVARPTLYSLLVIIAAYVPIFALQRVEGRIFAPMANTVVSALIGAMVLSFALVPVLTFFAFRRAGPPKPSPILRVLERAYRPTLDLVLRHAGAVVAFGLATLVAAGLLLGRIGSEFLPALNEGGLYITVTLPDNISLSEGRRMVPRLKALVARTPEVGEIMTQLGRPEDGTDPTLPNNLEIFARLAPREAWRPEIGSPDDIIAEISGNLAEIPGIERNFSMPIRDNVNENVSGQFGQVALKIRGDDLGQLADAAERARVAIAAVPGAADVGVVKSAASPALTIRIDREAIARFGVDLEDVQRTIATALGGSTVAELWEGERRFDITLRYPDAARRDAAAIRRLRIATDAGAVIPLQAVASVELDGGRAAITRESGKRYVGVRMNVRGRDMGSFVAEARAKTQAALADLPQGYELIWGGEFENQERAMRRLTLVVPLALVLTFLLLFGAFGRVGDALIVLLQVPMALTGGVFGLAAVGMPLSVSAAVGFIALLGQAVLNGVLVLAAVRAREQAGQQGLDAIRDGAVDRLRAVVMTALLAGLGLLPAALSTAIGSETQRPIAVVIVAGTCSAAALTLVVLPATLALLQRLRAWSARRIGPAQPPVSTAA